MPGVPRPRSPRGRGCACCWPARAASAPASTAPSRSSSWRSAVRRAGLRAPRDRPQPLRGRGAEAQGRGLRRGAGRGSRPTGRVVFSAHGVPKSVPAEARGAQHVLSSTPPARWCHKVHIEAERHFTEAAAQILLIGHAGHPEVVGTMGQLPPGRGDAGRDRRDGRERVAPPDGRRSPSSPRPRCRWTTPPRSWRRCSSASRSSRAPAQGRHLLRHHQPAGGGQGDGAGRCELILVVGAPNSSNSRAPARGRRARRLPPRAAGAARPRSTGARSTACGTVGITAGASAPEVLVEEVLGAPARALRRGGRGECRCAARTSPSSCRAALPEPSARWRSTRRCRRGAGRLPRGIRPGRAASPSTASPRVWRTPTSCSAPAHGRFILTLYEKRVDPAELPWFVALMQHLAGRGVACPLPVTGRDGEALRTLAGRPAAVAHLSARRLAPPPAARRIAATLGRALAALHAAAAGLHGRARATRWARMPGGPLLERCREGGPTACSPACAPNWTGIWRGAGRLAARARCRAGPSMPTSSPTTLSSPAAADRAHRLLFRLHGPAGLRPRRLPQRLVLRADDGRASTSPWRRHAGGLRGASGR